MTQQAWGEETLSTGLGCVEHVESNSRWHSCTVTHAPALGKPAAPGCAVLKPPKLMLFACGGGPASGGSTDALSRFRSAQHAGLSLWLVPALLQSAEVLVDTSHPHSRNLLQSVACGD